MLLSLLVGPTCLRRLDETLLFLDVDHSSETL